MLAWRFHRACHVTPSRVASRKRGTDLVALDKLQTEALAALRAYGDRRAQLERDLGRGAASAGGPDERFSMILSDLQYLFEEHRADDKRLRRRLDGRREPLLGGSEIQLALSVRTSTGAYHDRRVLLVLNDLLEAIGKKGLAVDAFRKRRQRWEKRLNRPVRPARK